MSPKPQKTPSRSKAKQPSRPDQKNHGLKKPYQKRQPAAASTPKRAPLPKPTSIEAPSVDDAASSGGERLQKFLRDAGVGSRRSVEQFILRGQIAVNGEVVTELGFKINPLVDTVHMNGRKLTGETRKLYLFYKPRGIITTLGTQEKRSSLRDFVLDLPVRVFPVGRLDRDVSGLLLLTNDGDLAQRLTHPSYRVPRIYVAMVHGTPGQKALAALKRGIELDDGLAKASEAKLLPESNRTQALFGELPPGFSLIELVVREGRHHFVKRLLSAAGHPVKLLSRTQFGPYRLGTLTEGEIRETTLPGE